MTSRTDLLAALPSVDAVLRALGEPSRKADVRTALDALRDAIRAGDLDAAPDASAVAAHVRGAAGSASPYPRTVNATGVFLHTGLGRTPLAPAAAAALADLASGFSIVEVDRGTGRRNRREEVLAELFTAVTGAPAGLVVNNNAAALVLMLRALGRRAREERRARGLDDGPSEVIVSRGELIEIGGGFRLPDIMETAGVRLVEVGATNRTTAADFERAITERTALLLRMHTSNYRIVGFTGAPTRDELVDLARRTGVPFAEDVGSGLLAPRAGALAHEPVVTEAVAAGVDLVLFSGDKLLGGPQAGLLVGAVDTIGALRADPMFRAFRPDRLTLAALAATLETHRRDAGAIAVLAALDRSAGEQLERARGLRAVLASARPDARLEVVETEGEAGSGSLPGRTVPSAGVQVELPGLAADELARRLRLGTPSVYPKLWRDRVVLDVFALLPGDDARLAEALGALADGS